MASKRDYTTIFAVCLVINCASFWIFYTFEFVNGQTTPPTTTTAAKVEEVQQQVEAKGAQLDTTTIAAAGAGAAGIIAVVKGLLDQRLNTRRDRTTDKDAGRMFILLSKFYQAKYLYPQMTDKEILDLPISNNPMARMSLGQAITAEADLWATGNEQYWNIPQPSMSVPTLTTVEAIKKGTPYPKVVGVSDTQTEVKTETKTENKPAAQSSVSTEKPAA